jgi:nucleotide-binding universal stress UspA family protein
MTSTNAGTHIVVVGVDGSGCSHEALRFAVNEARLRGAQLQLVTAWSVPTMVYAGGYIGNVDESTFLADAEAISTAAVEEARQLAGDVEIVATTPNEQPATALIEAAEGADLLVVGSRGHGGFARLLLGSVSEQLAHHSPCPVTIVRSGN